VPPTDDETLTHRAATLIPSATFTAHPSQTIRPADASSSPTLDAAVEGFRRQAGHREGAVAVEGVLGIGGMGIVHLARQTVVGRQVAVKSIRPEVASRKARRRLLEEAWVTGALEHPNIVPVYTITIDEDGEPHIILKRIEGESWDVLIGDAGAVAARFGAVDLLVWNVDILMRVCDAMHFAHSRGVIHRDIKPDNIMIGEFGEVYVLDWGLAVGMERDIEGRIPWAGDETRAAGTPRYMAPEMVAGEGGMLSPQSDIYLLGGVLYRLLTGAAPHRGETIAQTLDGIHSFQPRIPPDAPRTLARLCRAALSADPTDRPPSALDFKRSLQTWLSQRGAGELAAEATEQLAALEEALEQGADREAIYRRFGACRFGYQQALKVWPENESAQGGLRTAILHVARYELSEGDTRAVEGLLAELLSPPTMMVEALEVMKHTQAAEAAAVARFRAYHDPSLGQSTRIFITMLVGVLWTIAPLLAWRFGPPLTIAGLTEFNVVMLTILVGLMIWGRESMSRTVINRQVVLATLLVPLATLMFCGWGALTGTPAEDIVTLSIALYCILTTMLTISVELLLFPMALFYLVAFVIATLWPSLLYFAISGANLGMTVTLGVVSVIRARQYAAVRGPR
jgi:tRNA A-37 threonylcarbamoyl transferase component Bud32